VLGAITQHFGSLWLPALACATPPAFPRPSTCVDTSLLLLLLLLLLLARVRRPPVHIQRWLRLPAARQQLLERALWGHARVAAQLQHLQQRGRSGGVAAPRGRLQRRVQGRGGWAGPCESSAYSHKSSAHPPIPAAAPFVNCTRQQRSVAPL
jgi:hypothetical protein